MQVPFHRYLIILLALLLSTGGQGQTEADGPYRLTLKRDLGIGALGLGTLAGGQLLINSIDDVVLGELQLPGVPSFDRSALRPVSDAAVTGSDVVAYGALVMPATLLLDSDMRKDALTLTVIFAETMVLNQGLTDLTKGLVKRPRPYLYDPGLPASTVVEAYDRSSYFSNHTSVTAAASFFAARVFADYHPESPMKPYVWVASATLPAVAGFLRVRGAQHFPSDVVAGYWVGAVIGYGVPLLHRVSATHRDWTLRPGGNGLLFTYHFY